MRDLLPSTFCELPQRTHPWPEDIINGHQAVSNEYTRAICVLREDDGDPVRLHIQSKNIVDRAIPLMLALCGPRHIEDEQWMIDGTRDLCNLVLALEHASDIADRRYAHA